MLSLGMKGRLMNTMKHLLLAPILACGLVLASCGTTTGDRALSGGLLGAALVAAIGSLSATPARRSDRRCRRCSDWGAHVSARHQSRHTRLAALALLRPS